ncbi:hypothetical protein K501DRAFT_289557 [Backusella circina FSU 941]|nr:hypothetical protein K501DRAFT_289557 [Backusella circina FSU 941]
MSKSGASRLYLLLQNDVTIPIQQFQYTLYLNTNTFRKQNDYLECLCETKKKWLTAAYDGSRHDLFLLYSQYFHEFNSDSQLRLIDHIMSQILTTDKLVDEEEEQKFPDFYLLLAIYGSGCQALVKRGQEVVRIMDILDSLNKAITASLEGSATLITLPFIMILTQLTLEYMHASVGLTYAAWFESTFLDQRTTKLNKRTRTLLLELLYKMIPFEMPAVLQIQAKVLASSQGNYLKLCKARLLELGVDSTLKQYPPSITLPNKHFDDGSVMDNMNMVVDKIEGFLETRRVPFSLLEDTIFKPKWYQKTFLPELLEFRRNDTRLMDGRNNLVKALHGKKKIPDTLYKDFLKKNGLK